MTNQEILDNAPKGATHYSQGIHYLALNSSNSWMRYDPNGFANAKWFAANDYKLSYSNKNFRSLADIKRIAELEKVELETVTKTRKMFVANARKFGYSNSVGHTIQELQKWEQKLKEQE